MLNKFSLGYNMEKHKREKDSIKLASQLSHSVRTLGVGKRSSSLNPQNNNPLSGDITDNLVALGFDMHQIVLAHRIYNFISIEQAVHIMMKDPESGVYLHKYIDKDKLCAICNEKQEEHFFDENVQNIEKDLYNDPSLIIKENQIPQGNTKEIEKKMIHITKKSMSAIPKAHLEDFDDPDICRICFHNKVTGKMKIELSCGHTFCKDCVVGFLTVNINNGKVIDLKCLYGGCPVIFTDEEVKHHVNSVSWKKYKKFKISHIKLNDEARISMNCPYPDCEEIVEIDPTGILTFVHCANEHKFCSKCKQLKWHAKGKCSAVIYFYLIISMLTIF